MNLLCWSMAPSSRVTRKWEVFAGRNKFYCDGYLMSAPHTGVFYFTVFLITFTSTLFFAFDCPYLAGRITLAIPIIGGCLYVFTMGALLRTTFTDPGVIPRASQDEAAYIEKQIEVPNSLNSPTFRPPPRTKEVLVKGQTVKLKYCFTCKIFRPPRASHCSLCDNCVDRFDHHCPWVGNCVGKRNYRFFYMFIVSLAFLAVFIFACSLTHLILLAKDDSKQEFVDVIRQSPSSLVSSFICFLSIWSVIGLAGFHTYLTTSDQTTNEDIKGSFSSKGGSNSVNPYSHGNICLNCFYIICGPMTPSLIDRRGIVTDEYRIQMQQSERYHTPTLHVPITAQPGLGINEPATKNNFYDIESGPPTLLNNGVYRQRSYDNLQNGHSTSVAHLVENELPLSNISSPMIDAIELQRNSSTIDVLAGLPMTRTVHHNDDDDDDNESTENLSNRNNLSGSYSNLYRGENRDDGETGVGDNAEDVDDADPIIRPVSGTLLMQPQPQSVAAGPLTDGIGAPRENVYSNVPFVDDAIAAAHQSPAASDPSLHVYSNIACPKAVASSAVSATTTAAATPAVTDAVASVASTSAHDFSFGGMSAILGASPMKTDSVAAVVAAAAISGSGVAGLQSMSTTPHRHNVGSKTLVVDDLDLDDPVVMAASAFAMQPKKSRVQLLAGEEKKAAIEMKNVIPQKQVTLTNGTAANAASVAASNAFCSPSRMRLLHDTTMIDTALDLDSLDGSSLGNSSQACLVNKTAIV